MSSANPQETASESFDTPAFCITKHDEGSIVLSCHDGATSSNLKKIQQACETKNSKFSLKVPAKQTQAKTAPKAWRAIRDLLREHATSLHITCTRPEVGPGIHSFLVGSPWPYLRELHLDTDTSFPDEEEFDSLVESVEALEKNTFEPPFPFLKVWTVATHPNSHPARWASDMAPNLVRFELDTKGYPKCPDPSWDMHRNNDIHSEFLCTEKYRTIVTPARMRVFVKPGPHHFGDFRRVLRLETLLTHTPDYGVLISEMRCGKLFERRLTFDEFENTEDLRMVDLTESN